MDVTEMTCKKCGVVKPLEEFYRDRNPYCRYGRRKSCKECDKAYSASPERLEAHRRYNNSEKGKAAQQRHADSGKKSAGERAYRAKRNADPERREKHKLYIRAAALKYSRTEKGKAKQRAYTSQPEIVEKRKAYIRDYEAQPHVREKKRVAALIRSRTPEGKAQQKEYTSRPDIKEKKKARMRAYLDQPEIRERFNRYARQYEHQRRALKRSLPATFTWDDWIIAMQFFGNCCAYCGAEAPLQQEHFIPLVKGGPYTPGNIVPACEGCNYSKHDQSPESWCDPETYARVLAFLKSRISHIDS